MRLLYQLPDGRLSLTGRLLDGDIPPYAILSHTWSTNKHDEVNFQDILQDDGTAESKPGYAKLKFCVEQAKRDGLEYSWVDTCCINRKKEQELSESIRSMMRYYGNAARCYVYLADVNIERDGLQHPLQILRAFSRTRWLTRGWTVQELLAPKILHFFDSNERYLGDRLDFSEVTQEQTKIPESALMGAPMDSFSIEERLSWFDNRQTKRPEDIVYAALGLFDVHIPIMYGEGRESARYHLENELMMRASRSETPRPSIDFGSRDLVLLPHRNGLQPSGNALSPRIVDLCDFDKETDIGESFKFVSTIENDGSQEGRETFIIKFEGRFSSNEPPSGFRFDAWVT